jgi:hypothetical protein
MSGLPSSCCPVGMFAHPEGCSNHP